MYYYYKESRSKKIFRGRGVEGERSGVGESEFLLTKNPKLIF